MHLSSSQKISLAKELLMLEQRVLMKFLPENFDQLQNFTITDFFLFTNRR
jgi:hypothetical protein